MTRKEPYKLLEKKLTKFANQMLETYEKTNTLKEFCTLKEFDNQKKEFFQIARRTGLPKEFFDERDNVDNSMIAGDFTRAIIITEQDLVLKTILDSKDVLT